MESKVDDNSTRELLGRIATSLEEIKVFLVEDTRQRAMANWRGQPYVSSKWPRIDGDKFASPRLKRGNDPDAERRNL